MKTIKDINFTKHPVSPTAVSGRLYFDNGWSISVIGGDRFYGNGVTTFEVAIFKPNGEFYESPNGEQVKPYVTKDEVTKIMLNVQRIK